jgi:type VI secretion system protein ImpG
VTLWPVEVASARLDPDRVVFPGKPPQAVALLQIGLRATGGLTFAQLELDRLRFYIDAEGPLAFGLYELLLNNTCRLLVRGAGPGGVSRRSRCRLRRSGRSAWSATRACSPTRAAPSRATA